MIASRTEAPPRTDSPRGELSRGNGADGTYLSVAQVARRLSCSVSLVQKWRRLGWIRATRLGPPEAPVYGYLPEEVDRFAAARWNRRRGRPPKAEPAATAAAQDETGAAQDREGKEAARNDAGAFGQMSEQGQTRALNAAAPFKTPAAPDTPAVAATPSETPVAPDTPPTPSVDIPAPAAPPPPPAGRPLVLWDGDPREQRALVLARFPPAEAGTAERVAELWAHRYDDLALGEPAAPGETPTVLAVWHRGVRVA